MSVEMACFKWLHAPLVSFTCCHKVITWWQIPPSCDAWISAIGEVSLHFFASLLSFTLSSKIQSKICYREEFDRCKIHCMDEICLELVTVKGICNSGATNCGCLHQEMFVVIWSIVLIRWMKPMVHETPWKKSHVNGRLESIAHLALGARN